MHGGGGVRDCEALCVCWKERKKEKGREKEREKLSWGALINDTEKESQRSWGKSKTIWGQLREREGERERARVCVYVCMREREGTKNRYKIGVVCVCVLEGGLFMPLITTRFTNSWNSAYPSSSSSAKRSMSFICVSLAAAQCIPSFTRYDTHPSD